MKGSLKKYPKTSLFIQSWDEKQWGWETKFDNKALRTMLGVKLRPIEDSLIAMVESEIQAKRIKSPS